MILFRNDKNADTTSVSHAGDRLIALAGNPNVGKSTLFNQLTGMRQHTGNWTGKTVANAFGRWREDKSLVFADLPGTYSLSSSSADEQTARDFLAFGGANAAVVVCDACCLERNLNLVLEIIEIIPKTLVCLNLMDEADSRHIKIDTVLLEKKLGVPVCPVSARKSKGVSKMLRRLCELESGEAPKSPISVEYPKEINIAIENISYTLTRLFGKDFPSRLTATKLLQEDIPFIEETEKHYKVNIMNNRTLLESVEKEKAVLESFGLDAGRISERIVAHLYLTSENICNSCVKTGNDRRSARQLKIDRVLTGKFSGVPFMLLLLGVVLWLTITGANYPSALLSSGLSVLEDWLSRLLSAVGSPVWLHDVLILGIYRVLSWVVAVMLPPMAIFFPLFTLLEDFGYLPRVAFNLDHTFKKHCACGKQALTICMGLGCNAAGVVGCRIIDSPRERLVAILTNAFIPCNGRFPSLIAVITMFLAFWGGLSSALILVAVIVFAIYVSLLVSRLLSKTLLKGTASSFTLELPPYRTPDFKRIIVRSIFERTLTVLWRAVCVAAPAGLVIWLLANVSAEGQSVLSYITQFLDPVGRLLGLDGALLTAFILGSPANEIVIPIAAMIYLSQGTLCELSVESLKALFLSNGWTWLTAVCFIVFSLNHWPCTTTLLTIKKETGSLKWTLVSLLTPSCVGVLLCLLITQTVRLAKYLL